MKLTTQYEFTLPRGYVDSSGELHRKGLMRLATARDELEPLRDPTVRGPDDPRLTVLILARVVDKLGDLPMVTPHEIEGLFAADLAFLQDFYGVINFGNQQEYEELLAAQAESPPLIGVSGPEPQRSNGFTGGSTGPAAEDAGGTVRRARVEEVPRTARVEEIPRVPV